jgi:hypothetical protein
MPPHDGSYRYLVTTTSVPEGTHQPCVSQQLGRHSGKERALHGGWLFGRDRPNFTTE